MKKNSLWINSRPHYGELISLLIIVRHWQHLCSSTCIGLVFFLSLAFTYHQLTWSNGISCLLVKIPTRDQHHKSLQISWDHVITYLVEDYYHFDKLRPIHVSSLLRGFTREPFYMLPHFKIFRKTQLWCPSPLDVLDEVLLMHASEFISSSDVISESAFYQRRFFFVTQSQI